MATKNSRIARTVIAVVAIVAVAAGIYRYRATHRPPPVRYTTKVLDRGPIVARVMATGTLSALVTVQVGSQVSGRIKDILVDFNSPVRRGQVIARIDPQLFEAALAQARANHTAAEGDLRAATAQATNARRQSERTADLAQQNLVSPQDRDTALAAAESAEAQVFAARGRLEQATAALRTARVNLGYTTIVSPIDGIVVSRNVDIGQTVAASLQAPTLFVLAEDLRRMQVDTSVAEADIGRLRAGMPASFRVDAYPDRRFRGVVRQVRNAPQTVQNVITYDAVIDVDNAELLLKPGMTANVTFVVDERADVLRIPNAALRFRPPNGAGGAPTRRPSRDNDDPNRRTVFVLRSGRAAEITIRTGLTDGTRTEVREGPLRVGDRVITDASTDGDGSRAAPLGGMRRVF